MADGNPKEAKEKSSGGGLVSVLPLVAIAGAASFGMVWLAASPPPPVTPEMCAALESAEVVDPIEQRDRAARYVTLDPLTVSLGPSAGAKHVLITVALGTPADADDLTDVQFLRLRDQMLERLRTVDSSLITDPNAMDALKESLLMQAKATLGDQAVYSVLITEFLLK